ncbi:GvpL/GvpF family gas vesicle protein [Streptomyces sp. NPDC059582]|uniref:GvpL/GvpF family gas vesicle protein n=1 Tax=Streptomyces sp. NPDC059582 TaxID=3346875 RepID=UPI0036993A88
MTGLRYVYAVCRPFRAALQAQLTGVGGVPVGLLNHQGLVAVVSTVPASDFAEEPLLEHLADPDWRAAVARCHQCVIDALTAVTTPLPLRPATVCCDDSALRAMMEAREAEFTHTLDRLDGRVEWGVRVYTETQPAEEFATRLHAMLSRYAEDSRFRSRKLSAPELSGGTGHNVLNAAYLVSRADSEEFVEMVDRAKSDALPGVRVELAGPWAAYSFAGEYAEEKEMHGAYCGPRS